MVRFVRQLLDAKGRDVWSVAPDTSVIEALELMAEKNIGAVVVLDGAELVGILSERDYARKVALADKTSAATRAHEIMTRVVATVEPGQSIQDCMQVMTDRRIRHLPVMEEGRLVGLISIGDVVKAVISGQEIMIRQLESHITGNR